jgi:hypothetical protein
MSCICIALKERFDSQLIATYSRFNIWRYFV